MSEQYTPTDLEVIQQYTRSEPPRPGTTVTQREKEIMRFIIDHVRREARTITREQIATMSRAVAVHAAGNLPGLPDDEFECCFRAALHEAGFIIEQEGKNNE